MFDLNRLKDQRAFNRVFQKGKQRKVADISIRYYKRKDSGKNRVGFAVAKTVENAVVRNYCKRVMRELYYSFEDVTKEGYDIVLLCFNPKRKFNYNQLKISYKRLLEETNLLIN